jgi:predicted nucleotidyltransferase
MIEPLNYILDYNDDFWYISYVSDRPYGYMIYKKDPEGDRYNPFTKMYYTKQNGTLLVPVPTEYKKIYRPREFYKENKNKLSGIWLDFVNALNSIGIKDKDIGIFGSVLVGFDIIKDVDFVIYGISNLKKYYKNNEIIKKKLNVDFISDEHKEYQYNKHKVYYNINSDLKTSLSRNWSGIQLKNGVLSTPRFIDYDNMYVPVKKGEDKTITVQVIDGLTSSCMPRFVNVVYNNTIYKLYCTFWMFQSFAYSGETIEICGNVDDKNKIIIIDNLSNHYIKYIEKNSSLVTYFPNMFRKLCTSIPE